MRLRNERCDMRHVSAGVMTVYEFWDRLRSLGWKYREKDGSPVRRRLRRIREWAVALLADSQPMDGVPLWLYNELKHVEEGREVGRCPGGIPNETPFLADILFHGVLGGGRELKIRKPLSVYDENGNYTHEVNRIYER